MLQSTELVLFRLLLLLPVVLLEPDDVAIDEDDSVVVVVVVGVTTAVTSGTLCGTVRGKVMIKGTCLGIGSMSRCKDCNNTDTSRLQISVVKTGGGDVDACLAAVAAAESLE